MDDGQVITCSRSIAIIYYLTKEWRSEDGGLLVDIEGGRTYVPEFNSLVAFRIPRYHQVTKVLVNRPRFSVFGWFLTPGIKYELFTGEDSVVNEDSGKVGKGDAEGSVAAGQQNGQRARKRQRHTAAGTGDGKSAQGSKRAKERQ